MNIYINVFVTSILFLYFGYNSMYDGILIHYLNRIMDSYILSKTAITGMALMILLSLIDGLSHMMGKHVQVLTTMENIDGMTKSQTSPYEKTHIIQYFALSFIFPTPLNLIKLTLMGIIWEFIELFLGFITTNMAYWTSGLGSLIAYRDIMCNMIGMFLGFSLYYILKILGFPINLEQYIVNEHIQYIYASVLVLFIIFHKITHK